VRCVPRCVAQELDEHLYEECKRKYEEEQVTERQAMETRDRKWEYLTKVAAQKGDGR
jgi:serine/threonine-protein phosphatase 2A regulatory subunit B'